MRHMCAFNFCYIRGTEGVCHSLTRLTGQICGNHMFRRDLLRFEAVFLFFVSISYLSYLFYCAVSNLLAAKVKAGIQHEQIQQARGIAVFSISYNHLQYFAWNDCSVILNCSDCTDWSTRNGKAETTIHNRHRQMKTPTFKPPRLRVACIYN